MGNTKSSQRFQCCIRGNRYRCSNLHSIGRCSGTTCRCHAIYGICKNTLSGALGKGAGFCFLFLFCFGHLSLLVSFQTTGRNISHLLCATVICVNDTAPDVIYCTSPLQFIILKNFSYYFSVFFSRIIKNIAVFGCRDCIRKFIHGFRITEHAILNITDNLVLSVFLKCDFTPSVVTYGNSL